MVKDLRYACECAGSDPGDEVNIRRGGVVNVSGVGMSL